VEFIVEKSGELTNFSIVPTSNEILGNELIKVLKKSPKWVPGKQINEKGEQYIVRQKMSQEITFTLPKRD
jgi:periplasmic protein TonB